MIGKLRALQEVNRLRVTNYFTLLDDEGIGELGRMLSFADTEIIAVAVVNQWIEEQTERPTPADIRRLVAFHNEARQQRVVEPAQALPAWKCKPCEDSGLRGGNSIPWEWCDCPAAVMLRESSEDGYLDRLNQQRNNLMLLTERTTEKRRKKMLNVSEIYRDV
jgi:hypothetical protein